MGSDIDPNNWKRPRPPLLRLCSFNWTSSTADWGGVWQFIGIADADTPKELWTLRRVMSARIDGVTGDETKTYRGTYEGGGLRVWRSDLIDPAYKFKGEIVSADVAGMYRAAERALERMRKGVHKVFTAEVNAALKEGNTYKANALIKECPDTATQLELLALLRKPAKKKGKG